ncbi:MAG: DUF2911 domain-containing protein [Cyclobacteriaceae bacterium]
MKKKLLIGLGVLVVLIVAFMFWANNRNRTMSPPGSTSAENNGLNVQVDYSRPSVKGRVIFGTEAEGALQPHGKYWRLGANEPTKLTVNKDFTLNGQSVKAGAYDMYAIPSASGFEIRLNTGGRFWGYSEPDYSLDILKLQVPSTSSGSTVEQYTIEAKSSGNGVKLDFSWADRQWELMIAAQ